MVRWPRPRAVWLRRPLLAVVLRLLLGGLFVLSGVSKLIAPPENFMAIIHAFDLVPVWAERPIAVVLPWVETMSGLLLMLGLFVRASLLAVAGQMGLFTVALGTTLVRGITMDDCGCFGALGITESNRVAFVRDLVLLSLFVPLFFGPLRQWTLDGWLRPEESETINLP